MSKKNKIITSGRIYIDLDGFACMYAYKYLLDLKGETNQVVTTSILNASITSKYRDLKFYSPKITLPGENEFIIMDLSNPDFFGEFVDIDSIAYIFDHHPGYEQYWKQKIGDRAVIEKIGAAATLIFREYKRSNLLNKIPEMSAELLAAAILSNTLNFKAEITTEEDWTAYKELQQYFHYTEIFAKDYFNEVQNVIESNLVDALINDTKRVNEELLITQLEIWDAEKLLNNYMNTIKEFLASKTNKYSFLNLIELGKDRNFLIFNGKETLEYVKRYFPEFSYDYDTLTAITPRVKLRKELLRKFIDKK